MQIGDRRLPPRFWASVEVAPSGCWLWTGSRQRDGYPHYYHKGGMMMAHRASFAMLVAPLTPGLEIDHLCGVPHCVNPAHLEEVTGKENRRRKYASITRCKNDHAYTYDNTYRRPNGRRDCRACIRARVAKYQRKTGSAA